MDDGKQTFYRNSLQHIFMNYSLVEVAVTRKNLKIFRGYENYSLKNVLIKVHKLHDSSEDESLEKYHSEPIKIKNENCLKFNHNLENMNDEKAMKYNEDQLIKSNKMKNFQNENDQDTIHQIIKILDSSALPRTILEEVVSNYKVVIQEVPEGKAIAEIENLTISDFFSIFNQLLNLLNLLKIAKIKIPEINGKNIVISNGGIVKMKELKNAYFVDEFDDFEHILILKNIFITLEPKVNEIKTEKFKKLENFFQKETSSLQSTDLHELCKVCDFNFEFNAPSVSFVDYLVLSEIKKIGFKKFQVKNVNNKTKKEFFIYRIVEKQILKSKSPLISILSHEKKIQSNQLHHYVKENELKFPLVKEEQTRSIIRKRCEILNEYIQFSAPPCNLFACQSDRKLVYLEIPFFNPKKFADILKILRFLKLESWEKDNKIMIDDLSIGLSVVVCLSLTNSLIFYKNQGETENFVRLVSEILEIMKSIQ